MKVPEQSALPHPLRLTGVQLSAEEFVAVNFRLWRTQRKTRFNQWLLAAAILLLATSAALDVWSNGGVRNWSTVIFLGVAVLYALFRMALVRYQLRRGYAKNTAVQAPIDFELTSEGVRGHSSLGTFTGKWALIRRAVWVEPHWLLLYPTEAACYYLDLRCLQAPASASDIRQLLAQHQIPQLTA